MKKSPNGTNTINNGLSSDEVCSIIKVCGEVKVSCIQYRDLTVWFGPQPELSDLPRLDSNLAASMPSSQTEAAISAIQENQAKEALEQDEEKLKEDELALMLIENPQMAEKLLIEGKLDEEADESDAEDV